MKNQIIQNQTKLHKLLDVKKAGKNLRVDNNKTLKTVGYKEETCYVSKNKYVIFNFLFTQKVYQQKVVLNSIFTFFFL